MKTKINSQLSTATTAGTSTFYALYVYNSRRFSSQVTSPKNGSEQGGLKRGNCTNKCGVCRRQGRRIIPLNPFRTAVPFWGQASQFSSSLPPKRESGSKGVKGYFTAVATTTVDHTDSPTSTRQRDELYINRIYAYRSGRNISTTRYYIVIVIIATKTFLK